MTPDEQTIAKALLGRIHFCAVTALPGTDVWTMQSAVESYTRFLEAVKLREEIPSTNPATAGGAQASTRESEIEGSVEECCRSMERLWEAYGQGKKWGTGGYQTRDDYKRSLRRKAPV